MGVMHALIKGILRFCRRVAGVFRDLTGLKNDVSSRRVFSVRFGFTP